MIDTRSMKRFAGSIAFGPWNEKTLFKLLPLDYSLIMHPLPKSHVSFVGRFGG